METFNFRIINTEDGNQIIDKRLKTPYCSLSPVQMLEYVEMDNRLSYMDRVSKKARKASHGGFFARMFSNRVAAWR